MSFDLDTIHLILADDSLSTLQRLILLEINKYNGQTVDSLTIYTHLKTGITTFINQTKGLINSQHITNDRNTLTCVYNNITVSCTVDNISFGAVRKATPAVLDSVTKARQKLDELRMVGFVGTDALIAKLSRHYDNTLIKFGGKNSRSLPPNHTQALKCKNWVHFKRLYTLLVDRQFDSVHYLEAQFKAMNPHHKSSKHYPLPAMLYSNWAINNYLHSVQNHIARSNGEDTRLTEDDVISETMQSSHFIVEQLLQCNPELTRVQALMLSAGNVSDLYLAIHKEYLKHLIQYQQDLPEEIARVLLRFERDKEFKDKVTSIYQAVRKS